MKIAILNECFLNKEHLKRLRALGEVEIFDNTITAEDVIKRLKGADIAVVDGFLAPLNKTVISSADKLKLLVLPHNSYFMVDLETAWKKGITITNTPSFSTQAVAELVIGLMFAVNRKIALMDRKMREEPFESDPANPEHQKLWGFNLRGKTFGIIGLGKIGSEVASLAQGLGMNVIAFNRTPKKVEGVQMVSLKEVLKRSDVISINVSLNPETENIITEKEFSLMKPTAIFINVAQAKNVNAKALYKALKENKISGAGLDVIEGIKKGHPILELDNAVFTGHAGSSTDESFRENLPELVVSNIENFIRGVPQNLVNLK